MATIKTHMLAAPAQVSGTLVVSAYTVRLRLSAETMLNSLSKFSLTPIRISLFYSGVFLVLVPMIGFEPKAIFQLNHGIEVLINCTIISSAISAMPETGF